MSDQSHAAATSQSATSSEPTTELRIPGPPPRWLGFPALRALRRDYLGSAQKLQRDYGDITYMRLVTERTYDLFSPELVRAALVDQAPNIIRWERGIKVFSEFMGQGVMVTEGEVWQRQRRMLQPGFSPRRVEGYAAMMAEAAAGALDAAVPPSPDAGSVVDMSELMTNLTMDVILRTLFSSREHADAQSAAEAIRILSEVAYGEMFHLYTLPDWLPLPGKARKRWALRTLHELVGRHIQARRNAAPGTVPNDDLLAMLLAVRDDTVDGGALNAAEVHDQCMVIFQAGHDTSATALAWWSRMLAEHPQAAERAREEVNRVLAGRPPTPQDLTKLEWLTATLKEAMRLYPPTAVLMSRRTLRDVNIGGWTIPKGAMLRLTPWVIHRDARWFPEPEAFRPERFTADAPALPRGAWLPFGTGPRVCIGQHFAMLEMTLIAAMLLQRYTLSIEPEDAQRPDSEMHVTMRPKGGIRLRMTRIAS